MKEHIIKLKSGDDILVALELYCRKYDIEAAFIVTGIGGFSNLAFRKGYTRQSVTFNGVYELVSLSGTLSKGGLHIHGAFSDEEFKLIGGHLTQGCIVKTTAEIVIIESEEYRLTRSKDTITGYKGLEILRNIQECDNY